MVIVSPPRPPGTGQRCRTRRARPCSYHHPQGYGLGAQAMAAGSFKVPRFTVAWPTSELGGLGLERAVKLLQRREPQASDDLAECERAYGEIDDVIDPADSRRRSTIATGDRARRGSAPTSTRGEA